MNDDVMDEIGNVENYDAEDIRDAIEAEALQETNILESLQPSVDQGQETSTPTTQPQQTASTEAEPTLKERAKSGEDITFADTFGSQSANPLKNPSGIPAAMGAGITDFGIDLVNKIPGVNVPKLPKYESGTLQGIRSMSGIIIPSLYLGKYLKGLGGQAHAKVGWSLGNNPLMKFVGNAGLDAAAGAIVDEVNTINETDDNAAGALKKSWPQTYGWIPDDIATLDSDSPDVKRMKNRNEGIGLSFFGDIFLGGTKLLRELRGVDEATQWVPKSEGAKAWKAKKQAAKKASTNKVENEIIINDAKRKAQFDEMGDYNISQSIDLDQPMKGVHDIYDDYEVGFRTADDGGIISAQFDAVRISQNIESVQGRVGSVFTDSALKAGLNLDDAGIDTMRQLSKDLQLDVEWHSPNTGKVITHKQAKEVGEDLAASLYEMDKDQMKKVLDNFSGVDPDTGIKVLTAEGYVGVFNAIKKYFDDYINMDLARSQAYVGNSLSGQVSDLAEGARLMDGTSAVQNAQEQVLDRLQYLMNIKGQTSYARGRALNMLNLWNRVRKLDFKNKGGKKKVMANAMDYLKEETDLTKKKLRELTKESQDIVDGLRAINAEKPDMLKPLMLAYELTDGKVNTIAGLNRYFKESTGVLKKALIDMNPDMPSVFMQGVWGNIYNSVLSAIGTPLKAGFSNLALMIERPLATFAGAVASGDVNTLRRASFMYFGGIADTATKATQHMNMVFRQASKDPSSVQYIMRSDIAQKNADQIDALKAYADAKQAEGFDGPAALMQRVEAMNDLGEHPWLRFGANSMTAFDGFTRSFVGNIEARGKAYDQLLAKGQKITGKRIKKVGDKVYKEMFDETGMITDKGVQYASKEIAMNLDNPAVDSLSALITRVPALKPFLMFPKTATNMLAFAGSHNPLGLFVDELNAFSKPYAEMATSDVDRLLLAREIDISTVNRQAAYDTIRAELKGRKAIGTLSVLGAGAAFTSGSLRGNGHFDKTRQRTRKQLGYQPRTYKGWDGKWYSYDGLGGISDWIALTADVMDNFDVPLGTGTLDTPTTELFLNKVGYVLSANLTNKSFLAGLEPLNDVLAGNPAALSRWAASFGSSFIPGSGLRNELSRLLTPQLKEVEQEFFQLLANRNPIAKGSLPDAYDWMDGSLIREPENFFVRAWNAYSPMWKVSESMSPEKEFLMEIEFDGRPQLNTNGKGIEYSPEERSQVTQLMGQDGIFRDEVRKIMNSPAGKNFRKNYKKAQDTGIELERKDFDNIHYLLTNALRKAQRFAEHRITNKGQIEEKTYLNKSIERATREGNLDEILRLQKQSRRL